MHALEVERHLAQSVGALARVRREERLVVELVEAAAARLDPRGAALRQLVEAGESALLEDLRRRLAGGAAVRRGAEAARLTRRAWQAAVGAWRGDLRRDRAFSDAG